MRNLFLFFVVPISAHPLRLFSPADFARQVGQQELTLVLLYHSKDLTNRMVMDAFKRAQKDPEVQDVVAFMFADMDKYDLADIAVTYKISQFPAYLLFRSATLIATSAGQRLNSNGIVDFIMQHAEKEITKIREMQVQQAQLRAQLAEARTREMNARYPNSYVDSNWYYPRYWGYPAWGYGYPYYGWGYGRGHGVGYYRGFRDRYRNNNGRR